MDIYYLGGGNDIMGPIAISPACDITNNLERGTFSTDIYIDNRLGESVGILYRNGVNVIIPPVLKGRVANGQLSIYVHYRCQGGALLNQFSNFIQRNPKASLVDPEITMSDTSLRLVYNMSREQLSGSDVFYLDDLDMTIILDPTHGMPEHSREVLGKKERDVMRQLLASAPGTIRIKTQYRTPTVKLVMGNAVIALPALYCESGSNAIISSVVDNALEVNVVALDRRFIFPGDYPDERIKEFIELYNTQHVVDSSNLVDTYFDQFTSTRDGLDIVRRDLSKEINNASDAVERARAIERANELARIKHRQAMAGEGAKALSAVGNLGAKILDILS